MEKAYLTDKTLPDTFRGGLPATIFPHEFGSFRPYEPRRRVDEVFRYAIPIQMDKDIALFFIKKYPDRFSITDRNGTPLITDSLEELNYMEVKDILIGYNKELRAENKPVLAVIGSKMELIERVRTYRTLKEEEARIAREAAEEQDRLDLEAGRKVGTKPWARLQMHSGLVAFVTDDISFVLFMLDGVLMIKREGFPAIELDQAVFEKEVPETGWDVKEFDAAELQLEVPEPGKEV